MPKADIRDVSPFLRKVRNFLLGRPHNLALRFQDDLATRSPPLPNLPDGPAHRLSNNHYYARDVRREVCPPELIADQKLLASAASDVAAKPANSRTPGQIYQWD